MAFAVWPAADPVRDQAIQEFGKILILKDSGV
jgi:hypothetical protein